MRLCKNLSNENSIKSLFSRVSESRFQRPSFVQIGANSKFYSMSGPPRVKSMNCTDSESRPVLGPAGNKARSIDMRKPVSKPQRKIEKPQEIDESKAKKAPSLPITNLSPSPSPPHCITVPSILKQQDHRLLKSNLSLNASCSSDASSDSSHSRASTGRISRRSVTPIRRKQCASKTEKIVTDTDSVSAASADTSLVKKRCAWVTPNTDLCYADFP
ncbi:hypothetical protein F0562_023147 [Nyssa sinensis]|uniref:Uncharacterized protein n=1 Tax=Nyssa sinensis TaxID=561372 RepID=A0A5J5BFY0_9ASTE|nr:hypothetical protein F0562_023147 [Nyssa sinensis]